MASRLYRTTHQLSTAVTHALQRLQLQQVGTPTVAALMTLVVTGLILRDTRPTQTRVARVLPARSHDAHHRLLRTMPRSTRAVMRLLTAFAQRLGRDGYLALDDVIVEQAYAKRLPWAGWTSSCAKQRKVYGLPSVVLLWCACDGHWCIPVGFRLWRPKRSGAAHRYRTKLELAAELLTAVVQTRLPVAYVVVDTPSTASWFTKHLARLGLPWQGTLDPKTHVVWRGQRQAVRDVAGQQQLTWRRHLGVRATALTVVAPRSGTVRLVVTSNRHGNSAYLVRNAHHADLTTLVLRKRSRWPIETVVRDSQQVAGLAACQCWMDQAMVRHVALVWVSCVVLQLRRTTVEAPVAAVKERWQLTVLRDGEVPPAPLRACPPELRSTA